ncbi:MAG: hypothetical protein M5U09_12625 [Gammaproteobacteria bacterium]|nr:hypothetical protein [Gammaproteobacteria bacterium]
MNAAGAGDDPGQRLELGILAREAANPPSSSAVSKSTCTSDGPRTRARPLSCSTNHWYSSLLSGWRVWYSVHLSATDLVPGLTGSAACAPHCCNRIAQS